MQCDRYARRRIAKSNISPTHIYTEKLLEIMQMYCVFSHFSSFIWEVIKNKPIIDWNEEKRKLSDKTCRKYLEWNSLKWQSEKFMKRSTLAPRMAEYQLNFHSEFIVLGSYQARFAFVHRIIPIDWTLSWIERVSVIEMNLSRVIHHLLPLGKKGMAIIRIFCGNFSILIYEWIGIRNDTLSKRYVLTPHWYYASIKIENSQEFIKYWPCKIAHIEPERKSMPTDHFNRVRIQVEDKHYSILQFQNRVFLRACLCHPYADRKKD